MPDSELITVIGIRGSGKTHLVKYEILPSRGPLVIYDTIDEYVNYPGLADVQTELDLLDGLELGESMRISHNSEVEFDRLCEILLRVKPNYYLVVDEFHVLYQHHMSFERDVPNFKPLMLLGNHNNMSMILSTQRPTDFPKYVLTQTTTLYSFQIWHKADIEFIANIVENPEQFKDLEQFHYIRIDFSSPITITEGCTSL